MNKNLLGKSFTHKCILNSIKSKMIAIVCVALPISASQVLKEDQTWATGLAENALKGGLSALFSNDDLLPQQDKGKTFECVSTQISKEGCELNSFLTKAPKKSDLEGTESFFQQGHITVKNRPQAKEVQIPEEEKLVTCKEAGTYPVSFSQTRVVEVIPEVKKQVRKCMGHHKEYLIFWQNEAYKRLEEIKEQFAKDSTLLSFDAFFEFRGPFHRHAVICQWSHLDDATNCEQYQKVETIVQEATERDFWVTDFPEDLSSVESNPNCRLLYSQISHGPETRLISGQSVYKDIWGRKLFFACEPKGDSPCTNVKKQGGILVNKRCLKVNNFGDCEQWEKTYDLGKKAAYIEPEKFIDSELSKSFDPSYEKNNNLSTITSILSIFSDLKKEAENSECNFNEKIEIFRGEKMNCQCSFIKGVLYDCCKKMKGLAVSTYLARCNSEEQALAGRRDEGKCHFVGSKKERLGTQTSQVFCCFPTKLARIFHEEGRKQLQLGWGDAEEPVCRGLSIKELHQVDFTKMDLSEAVEDISINKEELLKKVRSTIENMQVSGENEGRQKTGEIVRKQEESLR